MLSLPVCTDELSKHPTYREYRGGAIHRNDDVLRAKVAGVVGQANHRKMKGDRCDASLSVFGVHEDNGAEMALRWNGMWEKLWGRCRTGDSWTRMFVEHDREGMTVSKSSLWWSCAKGLPVARRTLRTVWHHGACTVCLGGIGWKTITLTKLQHHR